MPAARRQRHLAAATVPTTAAHQLLNGRKWGWGGVGVVKSRTRAPITIDYHRLLSGADCGLKSAIFL